MSGILLKVLKAAAYAAFVVCAQAGFAQNAASTLVFDRYEWDFGTIREVDGEVGHVFSFTNTGDSPIVVERVKVDCGCTSPKYDSKPIAPGGKGTIDIVFDPKNYSGAFTKRVTVYSNGGRNRNLLTVKGSVIGRPRTVEEDYPFELGGGVRVSDLHNAFGYVENGSVKSMVISVINTSPATAHISVLPPATSTPGFSVSAPGSLSPGEAGDITMTYNLTGMALPVYGMLADRVFLSVNGAPVSLPMNANAVGVDNFNGIDRSKAAKCEILPVYHTFGEVKPHTSHTIDIKIANTGKSPLVVRVVSVRRNTECGLKAGDRVMPGRTLTVPVTLRTGDEYGVAAGGFTMVVNDPDRPFREVRVGADVY